MTDRTTERELDASALAAASSWTEVLERTALPSAEHMAAARECLKRVGRASTDPARLEVYCALFDALVAAQRALDEHARLQADMAPPVPAEAGPVVTGPVDAYALEIADHASEVALTASEPAAIAALAQTVTALRMVLAMTGPHPGPLPEVVAEVMRARTEKEARAELEAIRAEADRQMSELEDVRDQLTEEVQGLRIEAKRWRDRAEPAEKLARARLAEAEKLGRQLAQQGPARRAVLLETMRRLGTWAPGFEEMDDQELEQHAGAAIERCARAEERVTVMAQELASAWSRAQLGRRATDPVELAYNTAHVLVDTARRARELRERLDRAETEAEETEKGAHLAELETWETTARGLIVAMEPGLRPSAVEGAELRDMLEATVRRQLERVSAIGERLGREEQASAALRRRADAAETERDDARERLERQADSIDGLQRERDNLRAARDQLLDTDPERVRELETELHSVLGEVRAFLDGPLSEDRDRALHALKARLG